MSAALKHFYGKLKRPGESLKWRSLQSSASILSGDIYQHGLRLAANLIMTRLLHPEAFGLMLIVNILLIALEMLSDVGIRGAVILHSKKNEERYLDTAWTLQMLRGCFLAIVALLLAVPLANFYDNTQLIPLFMVSGFCPLLASLASPKVFIYQRDVRVAKIVFINVITQTLAVVIAIIWLLIKPSVWALIGHRLLIPAISSLLSYVMLESYRPRLSWDKQIVGEIFGFGKWIFLSTTLTYFSLQGDKVIMSKWLDTSMLGIYSIASVFAMLADLLQRSLGQKLLFPLYSEAKDQSPEAFNRNVLKVRLLLLGITTPIILTLALFGNLIIELLYDSRYHQAGWMLQTISAGSVFAVITSSLVPLMLAHGHSKLSTLVQAYKVCILFILTIAGGYLADVKGLIIGISLAPALTYPVVVLVIRRYGIYSLTMDTIYIAFSALIIGGGWWLLGLPFY